MARQDYVLDGSRQFVFPFPVADATDMRLQLFPGTTVPQEDYTVTGAGPASQGVTITWPDAPTDPDVVLTISRQTPPERVSDFPNNQAVSARALNAEFDTIYQILDELGLSAEDILALIDQDTGQLIQLDNDDVGSVSPVLPTAQALNLLSWNNDGTSIINRTVADIQDEAGNPVFVGPEDDEVPTNTDINERGFAQSVDSVSTLRTSGFPASLERLWLSGYYGVGTLGGGPLYRDADDTTTADNGGTVFVDADGARWKRLSAPAPEDWGAVGDGVVDDTDAIEAWWSHGVEEKLIARGRYAVFGTGQFALTVGNQQSLVVDATSSRVIVSEPRAYLFRVDVTGSAIVDVKGFVVEGNDNVARPIEVRSSTDSFARYVRISDTTATGVFGNDGLSFSSSAIGVRVACRASIVEVSNCIINGVNREYVNPGSVASVGISVTEVAGTCLIYGNRVLAIQSPVDDVDADGISVFSRDRLEVGRQRVNIRIYNNTLINCKGRFVKLQTTEAYVYGNRFESINDPIHSGFRGVDCQFGGCRIERNYWNLLNVDLETGSVDVSFAYIQPKTTGNWESRTVVADNFLVLERTIRYLCFVNMGGGRAHVEVRNNYVKNRFSADRISENWVRLNGDVADYDSVRLEIEGNTGPTDTDAVVLVDASFVSNADAANKASFLIANNVNTVSPGTTRSVLIHPIGSGTPHLNNLKIYGNETGGENRINAQSLTLSGIKPGSSFYFGTDGGTGGIVDAPSGLTRFVHTEFFGRSQKLFANNTSRFAARREGGDWYEYTGSLL